ncbi:MAG: hypothetical protein CMD70_07335 [Gammaproteobacteria bacterium]|nr:hypothetical protein [Gammaproteobacteria bacterium]
MRVYIYAVNVVVSIALLLAASALFAQNSESNSVVLGSIQKNLQIHRTMTPPVLDGVLDDEAWIHASSIEDLHQYEPVDHAEPSERTIVYITYDDDFLYVAARMWDSEPGEIRARQLVQNGSARWDDGFTIYLDPFNNKRTGYMFQTNPNGVRTQGTFETPTQLNRDWDDIWYAEALINEEGWAAELAIPFKTLNFDANNQDWGFTLERYIARKQEAISWSSYNREVDPGSAGLITGLVGLQQGRGLDFVPTMVTTQSKNHAKGSKTSETQPALDVFYNLTPSLTGVLSLNTDFSATEVDDRQVNLSRFSLFFPEKRDFFLQDSDIFSFGDLRRNGMPFHSRRIGLSAGGQPVDLDIGTKLTGRVGRFNVGVLGVQQDGFEDVSSSNLFVGRVAANVFRESSVGLIVTDGDPRSNLDNSLAGVDFRYRNTEFAERHSLEGGAWFQSTDTQGIEKEQDAWGVNLGTSNNNEGFEGDFSFQHIEENFNPALGFVNRRGIEFTDVSVGYRHLPEHLWLRELTHGLTVRSYEKISGGLESRFMFMEPFELETNNGDTFGTQVIYNREVLIEPFEIVDGVVISPGDYEYSSYGFELAGASERVFAPSFEYSQGEFFTGDRSEVSIGGEWRPNRRLFMGLAYEYNDIVLPNGSFITRLVQLDLNVAFNVRWSWVNLIQYDNESKTAGINSRLRWNPRAGQDLYVVLHHGFNATGVFRGLQSTDSQLSVKYTQTFRF